MVMTVPNKIEDRFSYDQVNAALVSANTIIKLIENKRKEITSPLDNYKKLIMDVEKEKTQLFKDFIIKGKNMMLDYNNEIEKKQKEANDKIKREAELLLRNASVENIAELMGNFTDKLTSIQIEQPKNVRSTKKAILSSDVMDVDWQRLIECLIKSGNFDHEALLKNLYKSMQQLSIDDINGIEIVEHKTQVIR
jgi:hypothetical protein